MYMYGLRAWRVGSVISNESYTMKSRRFSDSGSGNPGNKDAASRRWKPLLGKMVLHNILVRDPRNNTSDCQLYFISMLSKPRETLCMSNESNRLLHWSSSDLTISLG